MHGLDSSVILAKESEARLHMRQASADAFTLYVYESLRDLNRF